MKEVKALPAMTMPKKLGSKYDVLMDGKIWLVEEGDFDVSLDSVRASATALAKRRNLKLKSRRKPEGLYIQAIQPPGRPRSRK